MNRQGIILGLLADQSMDGLRGPFLGHDCSTTLAPAVFALRYHCELYTAVCYRTALAKWRLELGEKIPTHENNRPRPSGEIMRDVNRAFEAAVRRDPANWFWVHKRWKPNSSKVQSPESKAVM
jgi:KDO2-lipid IV(A) lauroyltransferase